MSRLRDLILSVLHDAAGYRRDPGTVQQASGNTVSVRLDTGALIDGVEVRPLAPGDIAQPDRGTRCLVGYADRQQPYIAAFEYRNDDAPATVQLGGSEGAPLARHGDQVEVGLSPLDSYLGVVITPDPAVAAAISAGSATLPVGTPVTVIGLIALPITGAVTSTETVLHA